MASSSGSSLWQSKPEDTARRKAEDQDDDYEGLPAALLQSAIISRPLIYLASTLTTQMQVECLGLSRSLGVSAVASCAVGHSQGVAAAAGLPPSLRALKTGQTDRHCLAVLHSMLLDGIDQQSAIGLRHFGFDSLGKYSGMLSIRGRPHDLLRLENEVGSAAIINGETSVVCSGDFVEHMLNEEAVLRLEEQFQVNALEVPLPYHSSAMAPSFYDQQQHDRERGGKRGGKGDVLPVPSITSAVTFAGKHRPETWDTVNASQLLRATNFPVSLEAAMTSHAGSYETMSGDCETVLVDCGPCEDSVAMRLVQQYMPSATILSAIAGSRSSQHVDAGILAVNGNTYNREDIMAKTKDAARAALCCAELSEDTDLTQVGLTSQSLVSFKSRLLDAFPKFRGTLPNEVFFQCPTLRVLVDHLAIRLQGGDTTALEEVAQGRLPPIERISVCIAQGSVYPLSFGQEQMLRLQYMNPLSCAYNCCSSMWIAGGLDPEKLRCSLLTIISRHEVFSSLAVLKPPTVKLRAAPPCVPIIRVQDEVAALARMGEVGRIPFNLTEESSMRVEILVTDEGLILLNLWVHHMNYDILSQGCFLGELYLLLCSTGPEAPRLPNLPIQYVDYAHWTREMVTKDLFYSEPFLEELAPHHSLVLKLPCDYPRPKNWTFRGDRVVTKLNFEGHVPHEGITPFIVFLTAFFIQLSKASGQENVIMGVPYHGRDQACLEPLCGYFINMVPVVSELKRGTTVIQALKHVQARWTTAAKFSHVPFLHLMDLLTQKHGFRHHRSRNQLFQAMINYRKDATKPVVDSRFLMQPVHQVEAHLDLDLQIDQVGRNGTIITHNYCTDLFAPRTVELFAAQYMAILRCLSRKEWSTVDIYRLPADVKTVSDVEEAPVMSPERQYDMFAPLLEHLGLSCIQPPLIAENKSGTIFINGC